MLPPCPVCQATLTPLAQLGSHLIIIHGWPTVKIASFYVEAGLVEGSLGGVEALVIEGLNRRLEAAFDRLERKGEISPLGDNGQHSAPQDGANAE